MPILGCSTKLTPDDDIGAPRFGGALVHCPQHRQAPVARRCLATRVGALTSSAARTRPWARPAQASTSSLSDADSAAEFRRSSDHARFESPLQVFRLRLLVARLTPARQKRPRHLARLPRLYRHSTGSEARSLLLACCRRFHRYASLRSLTYILKLPLRQTRTFGVQTNIHSTCSSTKPSSPSRPSCSPSSSLAPKHSVSCLPPLYSALLRRD